MTVLLRTPTSPPGIFLTTSDVLYPSFPLSSFRNSGDFTTHENSNMTRQITIANCQRTFQKEKSNILLSEFTDKQVAYFMFHSRLVKCSKYFPFFLYLHLAKFFELCLKIHPRKIYSIHGQLLAHKFNEHSQPSHLCERATEATASSTEKNELKINQKRLTSANIQNELHVKQIDSRSSLLIFHE